MEIDASAIKRMATSTPREEIDIDQILLSCIEKGFDRFDTSFKTVVYFSLKTSQGIEGKGLVQKPLSFAKGLRDMFGAGSTAIEKSIVTEIGERFRISTRQEDLVSIINRVRNAH